MTTNNKNHYEFVPKPVFPTIKTIYPDSIDWTKANVDPYSYSGRHTRVVKSQVITNKSRDRVINSTFNTVI